MKRVPHGYSATELLKSDTSNDVEIEKGRWVPARCEPSNGMYPWTWRFKMAWAVFTGEADALFWEGQ